MYSGEVKHLEEIARVQAALEKTKSKSLKYQYTKYLHRLKKELTEYRIHQRSKYGISRTNI